MYINSMSKNIQRFLNGKQNKIKKLKLLPIIMEWMNSPTMKDSLDIIDKHVEYLLSNQGASKLEQWFLSDDKGFNAITAERYIIRHLQKKNKGIVDNLDTNGTDAYLNNDNNPIGIEVTTLNKDIIDWIFTERLKPLLESSGFLNDKGLEISYSQKRVWSEFQGRRIYEYLNDVGKAIVANQPQVISDLGIVTKNHFRFPGAISWRFHDRAEFGWFELLTDELNSKLEKKSHQFKKYPRNLVFVGLNHSVPSDGVFPRIFNDLVNNEIYFHSELQELKDYWNSQMSRLTNVIGVCYFFYSIERETPFYPLKIFWRSEEDKISINV